MGNKNKTIALGITIAVAVIVLIAGIVAVVMTRTGEDNQASDQPAVEQPQQDNQVNNGEEARPDSENLPGAMVGNTQRTWPDPIGEFDDSPHATPGQTSVDPFLNRPVFTPNNHDGDFPKKDQLKDGKCQEQIELEGKTQQQYVNARYLVVNEQAGPTRSERGVPRGYAHSPQGAVAASLNQITHMYGGGDGIGDEIDKQLWATSKQAQEEVERLADPVPGARENTRARTVPSPTAYRVVNCSDNAVVADVLLEWTDDEQMAGQAGIEASVVRIPMFWRDGDWTPDFSGASDEQLKPKPVNNRDEFTEVVYS